MEGTRRTSGKPDGLCSKGHMTRGIQYTFTASLWRYPGKGGWCFVSLPHNLTSEIRSTMQHLEEGWGRLHVRALIGTTIWHTAIWFDTRYNTYLLPVKKEIRLKESLSLDTVVNVTIWI